MVIVSARYHAMNNTSELTFCIFKSKLLIRIIYAY